MTSQYHVVFINEASAKIGMGHILRSKVLAKKMLSRGYKITGVTVGDEKAVTYAQERARQDGFKWQIFTFINAQDAIEKISCLKPHAVVVDCTVSSKEFICACVSSGILVTALDYFSTLQPLPNAIINLIDHNSDALLGRTPERIGTKYYEGPAYAIIRDEFLKAREHRINTYVSTSIKKILIAFGGADPMGNTKHAFDMITQWPDAFTIDVIIGPLFQLEIKKITEKIAQKNKLNIY